MHISSAPRLTISSQHPQWRKSFQAYKVGDDDGSITVSFDDGSSCRGFVVVGCDGGNSRIRRQMFPGSWTSFRIPIRIMGLRASFTPETLAPMRKYDPYFLQGANPANDTFAYFSGSYYFGRNGVVHYLTWNKCLMRLAPRAMIPTCT
jgi:2-polyprenyl-6-methoxyphenol hydroxylase-like FAD-dependent oxidoreductase